MAKKISLDIKSKIKTIQLGKLKEYKNNPRINDGAIPTVQKSIESFGYLVPIIVDKNYEIIAGHTRIRSLMSAGYGADEKIDVIFAENLSDDEVKAFRIMENKSNDKAIWDKGKLVVELQDLSSVDMVDLSGYDNIEFEQLLNVSVQPVVPTTESNYGDVPISNNPVSIDGSGNAIPAEGSQPQREEKVPETEEETKRRLTEEAKVPPNENTKYFNFPVPRFKYAVVEAFFENLEENGVAPIDWLLKKIEDEGM